MNGKRAVMSERRRFLHTMGIGAAAAAAYGAFGRTANVLADAPDNKAFAVTTVNHLSSASENYVENYEQAKVKAELDRRGIASRPNPAGGLLLKDPNGLDIGVAGTA